MLPKKPPPEFTKKQFSADRSETNSSESLLDTALLNPGIASSHPVLLPNNCWQPKSSMNQSQSNKTASSPSDNTMAQTQFKLSDMDVANLMLQPTSKSRSARKSRYQDAQQVTKNPLKSLSPIHEEEQHEESVESAPPDASDDDFATLTMSISHPSTFSNGSTSFSDQCCKPNNYFTNPLSTPQFYYPEQLHQVFNSSTRPPHYPNNEVINPQEPSCSYVMAPAQPSNLSPTRISHLHPSYRRLRSTSEDVPAGRAIELLVSQDRHFSYNRSHTLTNCNLRSCNKPTTSTDISTCVCPRCGPFSIVRYCSVVHLHADLRRHYIEDCTRRTNMLALIATGTLEPFNKPTRPFIPANNPDNDSLERHRQAVHHSYPTNSQVSYCVFNDADILIAGEQGAFIPSPSLLGKYRGYGELIATVAMRDQSVVKAQFVGTLEKVLAMGVSAGKNAPDKCRLLFNWIKVYFEGERQWDQSMMNRIALAMQLEFGYKVPLKLFESEAQYGG